MTDIVERLRDRDRFGYALALEAAAEIERLQAQNAELLEERARLLDELFKQPALGREIERLRAFVRYVQDYSNDPQIVARAARILEHVYSGEDDHRKSYYDCLEAVRKRVQAGGETWKPKEPK